MIGRSLLRTAGPVSHLLCKRIKGYELVLCIKLLSILDFSSCSSFGAETHFAFEAPWFVHVSAVGASPLIV